jgi:2-methylcitrate dehydratase PrpD
MRAMPTLTERLSARLLASPTAEDRVRARLHLNDWLVCALGATNLPAVISLKRLADQSDGGPAQLLDGRRVDPLLAAFILGGMGNPLEMDDVHRTSILHPGPIVIPAALAAAQAQGASFDALLDAIVRGYEATIRVGEALGASHYRYFHTTSSAGAFGAAAAVGSVLNLTADELANALGNAGTRTGGLWQLRHENVPSKILHNAQAARAGFEAAQLAAFGFAGPRQILEGPQGLFAATATDPRPERIDAPAAGWLIHDCSFKPWPACRHAHPAIDAALELRRQLEARRRLNPFSDPGPVVAVRVLGYADALKFCDRPNPATELEAKFSLQHAVALALLHGEPTLAHYREPSLTSDYVARLRARITLGEDADLSTAYPAHYGAEVELKLGSGIKLKQRVADALGDPELPFDARAHRRKAQMLLGAVGIDSRAQATLLERCAQAQTVADWSAAVAALKLAP